MTANWTKGRKIAFWTHLLYILIPGLAALVAAVRLWTFIFGSAWFAAPLILCLEGVAALGFYFHLTKVDSPFVKARHFIPFFSVATLGYELGDYLVSKHGPELGIPVTVFVVGIFGFLFIKSFGVLERLMIDPVQAAAEKATELTKAILIPVEEHSARAAVFRDATLRLQAADRAGKAQPQLTLDDVRAVMADVLASQPLLTASVAPRVAVPEQPTFVAPQPSTVPQDEPMFDTRSPDELRAAWKAAEREVAAEDCCGQCEAGCLDCPLVKPEPLQTASEEDHTGKGQDFGDVIVAAVADGVAWLDRNVAEVLDEKLASVGLTRESALALLQQYGVTDTKAAYKGLKLAGKLPSGVSESDFEVLYKELTNPKPAGTPCEGESCTNTLNNAQKGVARKWAGKRNLGDAIFCTACRAKHPAN